MIGRDKYLSGDEVQALMKSAEDRALADVNAGRQTCVREWMVVDLVLSTGLRVSELARLTCGDVQAARSALQVRRSKKRRAAKPELLAVPDRLIEHLRLFVWWKASRGESAGPGDPILVDSLGYGPMGIRSWQRAWGRALRRAGLPLCGIHCGRHTVATHMLRQTRNLRMVQLQLGHENPATTANLYAHVPFEDMQTAVNDLFT